MDKKLCIGSMAVAGVMLVLFLLDLVVNGRSDVLAVGAYGLALRTKDGGGNWALANAHLDNPKSMHLYAVRRRDRTVLIAGEQGLLLRSDDGGQQFRKLSSPYQGSFFTAELLDSQHMVAAGLRGNIWQSADAGDSWKATANPVPASVTDSVLRPDGTLLLATQAGQVLDWRDGALARLDLPDLPPLSAVLALHGDALLALSVEGLHVLSHKTAR